MIPSTNNTLVTRNIEESASFGLSKDDSSHIMNILRDTLYTDRMLAVLREYSSNAWDAHRMCGKGDLPIKVILPTHKDTSLKIRDFGPGLSRSNVFDLFTKYGKSTKRSTNDAVGSLGIGCKSAFSYVDAFTVTSWHMGSKSVYVAALDASDKGTMNLMHEEQCPSDETGIEISLRVDAKDIHPFHVKASWLYSFFDPRPDVNLGEYDYGFSYGGEPMVETEKGMLVTKNDLPSGHRWVAVMGCVPYQLDFDKLDSELKGLDASLRKMAGILKFDIGEIDINASRETVKYTNRTKKSIVSRANDMLDMAIASIIKRADDECDTPWEKRVRFVELVDNGLSNSVLPDLADRYIKHNRKMNHEFIFKSRKPGSNRLQALDQIPAICETRLVIVDVKSTSAYEVKQRDICVIATPGHKDDFVKSLDSFIVKNDIKGIKVVLMSSLAKMATSRISHSAKNSKHRKKVFHLKSNAVGKMYPASSQWDEVDDVPDDAVIVLIEKFHVTGDSMAATSDASIFDHKRALGLIGVDLPDIYGYKTSNAKPVKIDECSGVPYKEWLKKTVEENLTDEIKSKINFYNNDHYVFEYGDMNSLYLPRVSKLLGESHVIFAYANELSNHKKPLSNDYRYWRILSNIYGEFGYTYKHSNAYVVKHEIMSKYPMLSHVRISSVWDMYGDYDNVRQYIHQMDELNLKRENESEK